MDRTLYVRALLVGGALWVLILLSLWLILKGADYAGNR